MQALRLVTAAAVLASGVDNRVAATPRVPQIEGAWEPSCIFGIGTPVESPTWYGFDTPAVSSDQEACLRPSQDADWVYSQRVARVESFPKMLASVNGEQLEVFESRFASNKEGVCYGSTALLERTFAKEGWQGMSDVATQYKAIVSLDNAGRALSTEEESLRDRIVAEQGNWYRLPADVEICSGGFEDLHRAQGPAFFMMHTLPERHMMGIYKHGKDQYKIYNTIFANYESDWIHFDELTEIFDVIKDSRVSMSSVCQPLDSIPSELSDVQSREYFQAAALHGRLNRGIIEDYISRFGSESLNESLSSGVPPLILSAQTGSLDGVNLLLEYGADPRSTGQKYRSTALHMAAQKGHRDIAIALLNANADVDARDTDGATPLYFAAQNGFAELLEALLSKGADVNAFTTNGSNPLMAATKLSNSPATIAILKKWGAVSSMDSIEGVRRLMGRRK